MNNQKGKCMSDLNTIIESQKNEQREAADGALEEYLENLAEIDTKKHMLLDQKLETDSYKETFQSALMQMSLLISAAMVVADEREFNKIQKKVLLDSRADDSEIQEMRLFYAQTITPDELSLFLKTDEEKNTYDTRISSYLRDYKEMRQI